MTASDNPRKKLKANKIRNCSQNVHENINKADSILVTKYIGTDYSYKHQIVWKNAIGFLIIHVLALWGFAFIFTGVVSWKTSLWALCVLYIGSEGVTIGAHRYYTHRSFKATPLLRAIMIATQTVAGQNSMFIWCRDHRLHHRYSDTDGDPHNSKRGFFFCHMGWLMHKKHPYVIELGRRIDLSDLKADWMVMFQKKYYYVLYLTLAIFLPVWVPVYYFGETLWDSLLVSYFARYVCELHGTWTVNSIAHLYGTRPYDQNLQPVESWFVSLLSLGEGWHNYHHAFPWDYKAAELTMHFNLSASIIRFFERIGLAYDLKSASLDMVTGRIKRTGDGSHYKLGTEKARVAVTAWGPLHPLNPTYNTTLKAPDAILKPEGLPLYHENDFLNGIHNKNEMEDIQEKINTSLTAKNIGTDYSYKHQVVWLNAIGFLILHLLGLWGLLTGGIGIKTLVWTVFVGYIAAEGITTGAHRYYTHRTFKATPLRAAPTQP